MWKIQTPEKRATFTLSCNCSYSARSHLREGALQLFHISRNYSSLRQLPQRLEKFAFIAPPYMHQLNKIISTGHMKCVLSLSE